MSNINNIMNYLADNLEVTSDITQQEEAELLEKLAPLGSVSIKEKIEEVLMETLGDYVVERGTDGSWEYEKWVSGKTVCWCNVWFDTVGGTNSATVYYPFPINNPVASVSPKQAGNTSATIGHVNNDSSNGLTIYWQGSASYGYPTYLQIIVYGRWK